MSEMRRVVAKAREMQTQRDSLIQSLREDITNDDITSQLLARSSENTEDIFKEELQKHGHKVSNLQLAALYANNIGVWRYNNIGVRRYNNIGVWRC